MALARRFLFCILVMVVAASAASAGDSALDRVIGPVQGRSGPPYIEATGYIDIGYFQQEKWDKLQGVLDGLAQKSDMNMRVLTMSVRQKMCQMTRTSKPSMKTTAQQFKGATHVAITVKKNGSIEIKGFTAQPKAAKR